VPVRGFHGRSAWLVTDPNGFETLLVVVVSIGVVSVHDHVSVQLCGAREFPTTFAGGTRDASGIVFATVTGRNGLRVIGTPPGVARTIRVIFDVRRLQREPETFAAMVRHQVVDAQTHLWEGADWQFSRPVAEAGAAEPDGNQLLTVVQRAEGARGEAPAAGGGR